jgi:hypothetical protein
MKKLNAMTKSNTRLVLVIILAAASFASYLYLSTLKYDNNASTGHSAEEEITESELNAPGKSILPDVYLLKKAVEAGKRLMPYQ